MKDDSGSYAVFIEKGSSASQMTTAEVMDVRHLDSSTTTQMAKIMVQYGRPSRSS